MFALSSVSFLILSLPSNPSSKEFLMVKNAQRRSRKFSASVCATRGRQPWDGVPLHPPTGCSLKQISFSNGPLFPSPLMLACNIFPAAVAAGTRPVTMASPPLKNVLKSVVVKESSWIKNWDELFNTFKKDLLLKRSTRLIFF